MTSSFGSSACSYAASAISSGQTVSSSPTIIRNGVGEISQITSLGSYSPTRSTLRSVISFRHAGARSLRTRLNHSHASVDGSITDASGSGSTTGTIPGAPPWKRASRSASNCVRKPGRRSARTSARTLPYPADEGNLRHGRLDALVVGRDDLNVPAGEAAAPDPDLLAVNLRQGLGVGDRVPVVASLGDRINLLPGLTVAGAEVTVVEHQDVEARPREVLGVIVEVHLLHSRQAVRHDDHRGRGGVAVCSVEPAPQNDALGVELDITTSHHKRLSLSGVGGVVLRVLGLEPIAARIEALRNVGLQCEPGIVGLHDLGPLHVLDLETGLQVGVVTQVQRDLGVLHGLRGERGNLLGQLERARRRVVDDLMHQA